MFKVFRIWQYAVLVVCLNSFVGMSAVANETVTISFSNYSIVPDVIPVAPQELLDITFGAGLAVNLGNEVTPSQVRDAPTVRWNATAGEHYTLIFTDPDAPSRADPYLREWHHWLVGNIPGSNVSAGEVLTEFLSSGPNNGTGLHRYTFLVYRQPSVLTFDEPRLNTSYSGRERFSTANFTRKYNLTDPVAGNFYLAQYEIEPQGNTSTTTEAPSTTSRPNSAGSMTSCLNILLAVLVLSYVRQILE